MKLLHALADKRAQYSYRFPATHLPLLIPCPVQVPVQQPIKPIRNKPGSYCVCFSLLLPFFIFFLMGSTLSGSVMVPVIVVVLCFPIFCRHLLSLLLLTSWLVSYYMYLASYLNQPTFWAITLNLDIILYFDNGRF